MYTAQSLSIGSITRRLNELAVPTRKQQTCWERSTIWAMLRNPAYRGMACFGKTQEAARQHRDNRAVRMRSHPPRRAPRASQQTPKDQWIQIPVPALVDEHTFDLAQERLQDNKKFSPRRTVEPSILQGLVHCAGCGYALYRTSTRSSARKIYYYRCLGSDAWRYQGQARCHAQPIRLDLLEETVWAEVARLLEDPALIQAELTRRVEAARTSHPAKQHQDKTTRELLQAQRRVERLLTAYQEDLLSLEELRRRMPELRQRETRLKAELDSLSAQLADQATYLRLAHTLGEFLERLHTQTQGLDVLERQRVVRLLVKEVVVGDDSITIRHSIPNSNRFSGGGAGPLDQDVPSAGGQDSGTSSLLRTWGDDAPLRRAGVGAKELLLAECASLQELHEQPVHLPVSTVLAHALHQLVMVDVVEAALDVAFDHPLVGRLMPQAVGLAHAPGPQGHPDVFERAMASSSRPEAVGDMPEARFQDGLQKLLDRALHHAVCYRGNTEGAELPRFTRLGDELAAARARHISAAPQCTAKLAQEACSPRSRRMLPTVFQSMPAVRLP